MSRKLKERVIQLEQILLGIQEETGNPLLNNRLEEAIMFMKSMAFEMSKTQTFLENLLQELQNNNIISNVQVDQLKIISDLETDLQYLKSRLADVIRRENELREHDEIPDALKENTKQAKISLCKRIEDVETELKELKKYERSYHQNPMRSNQDVPPSFSIKGNQTGSC